VAESKRAPDGNTDAPRKMDGQVAEAPLIRLRPSQSR
jgi:hypothetical protein